MFTNHYHLLWQVSVDIMGREGDLKWGQVGTGWGTEGKGKRPKKINYVLS